MSDFLDQAVNLLEQRATEPDYVHWVIGKNGDDLEGDFCAKCIDAEVARVLAKERALPINRPDDLSEIRGIHEYPETESDGCRHCDTCGDLLAYVLTDDGVAQELEYFVEQEHPWDWNDPDACYELERIAMGICEDEKTETLVSVLKKGINQPAELMALEDSEQEQPR